MQSLTVRNDLSQPALSLDTFKFDTSAGSTEDNYLLTLDKEFTKCLTKRGILFSTTGLRNIRYTSASLQYFATLFSNDINHQMGEDAQTEPYKVELKPLDTQIQYPCPLKITIQRLSEKTQFLYVGVFYSWRAKDTSPCEEYLKMSFLFVSGSHKFIMIMNDLFQKYFGCKIAPIVFTQNEMKWLVAIMAHRVDELNSSNIQFTYRANFDDSKLEFDYSFRDLKKIWNLIHDEEEDVIKYDEVIRLYATMNEHILEVNRLDLCHYLLRRFSIPQLLTIDSDGKMCSQKIAAFDLVCRYLQEQRLY